MPMTQTWMGRAMANPRREMDGICIKVLSQPGQCHQSNLSGEFGLSGLMSDLPGDRRRCSLHLGP